ncbi:hypothetical protein NDU88_003828 [Pleurodeles waltl]|uniref:Uncharacterized protein n=1 Tax=Pleurodeles waltl TaxID=8319 RepID=A0AAV7T7A6_PLEWA|nr:hypothetical protein NDU88_003828 [Pleurodeles waltl]
MLLYSQHRKSGASAAVLVLPSATPGERSERGRKEETVAARVPPRYAFGDRGHFYLLIKFTVLPSTLVSLAYFIWRRGSPDAADLRVKSRVCGNSTFEAVTTLKTEKKKFSAQEGVVLLQGNTPTARKNKPNAN